MGGWRGIGFGACCVPWSLLPACGGVTSVTSGNAGTGGGVAVSSGGSSGMASSAGGSRSVSPSTGGSGGVVAATSTGGARASAGGATSDAGQGRAGAPPAAAGHGGSDAGDDAGSAAIDGGQLTDPCRFVFEVTTLTSDGKFAPHNVGAIWIETNAGAFVKTLRTWGTVRLIAATAWVEASMLNRVDAVSGATRNLHGRLRATWNCTDVSEQPIPDGTYRVCTTFTESNPLPGDAGAPRLVACDAFPKRAGTLDSWPPSTPHFADPHVYLQSR